MSPILNSIRCQMLTKGENQVRQFHDCYKISRYYSKYQSEFRFESPISISKWNNCLDFRRKSENYFKVKIFSDSRPKSAQKLILKVFADFQTKIICRLSKIFKIFIWCYTCARMVFLVSCEIKKAFNWVYIL